MGSVQPRRGHRPCFLSTEKCKISFLAAGGQAWLLPSEQREDSGQPPGPHPLPCPRNCGNPVTQAAAARAWSPSTEPRSADAGQGPRVGLGGELAEEQGEREVDDVQPLGRRWQKTHPKMA